MPPSRQRKFDLIPTTLATTSGSKPPMTSKAAKKAYAKANRGPKISRAEQRRLEAEELARQKKEFEREKASKKAKAAREKKAEKEEQARQERKKAGLPEPNKFVRASQPSISRFVRGDGGKRKWREVDGELERTVVGDDESGVGGRPAKRLARITEEEEEEEDPQDGATDNLAAQIHFEMEREEGGTPQDIGAKEETESEDEFGEFPSISQPDFLEKIDSSLGISSGQNVERRKLEAEHLQRSRPREPEAHARESSQELPAGALHFDEPDAFDEIKQVSDMVSAQLLSEEAAAVAKSDGLEPPGSIRRLETETLISIAMPPPPKIGNFELPLNNSTSRRPGSRNSQKLQKSTMFAQPPKSEVLPRHFNKPSPKLYSALPPSTQAFLEDNINDFLPSPSQEMRELLDDVDLDDLPSNTQISREISPAKSAKILASHPLQLEEDFDDLICTQDFILSSQDLREISPVKVKAMQASISKSAPKSISWQAFEKSVSAREPFQFTYTKQTSLTEPVSEEFLYTQDLILTPQDFKKIETPCRVSAPPRTKNNLSIEMRRLLGEKSLPSPNPAHEEPRWRYDLPRVTTMQAHQALTTAARKKSTHLPQQLRTFSAEVVPLVAGRQGGSLETKVDLMDNNPAKLAPRSKSNPILIPKAGSRAKPRFFEEKENDLYTAAIHESKVLADQHHKADGKFSPPPLQRKDIGKKDPSKASAPRKSEAFVGNSIHTDGANLGKGGNNGGNSGGGSKRTLQRVQSAVTDYGDDEFEGLSVEDLFRLC